MNHLTLRSHVGADGIFNLLLPSGLQDVDVEVTVIPISKDAGDVESSDGWQSGFFEYRFGP